MPKNKPIGNIEIEDNGEQIKIPFYHNPKINCGCMNCRLANNEISLDFYKGYFLGKYIAEMYAVPEEKQAETELYDEIVNLFFSESELADFIVSA